MLRKVALPFVVATSVAACATLPAPPPTGSQQPTAAPARAKVTHIRFSLDWAIEGPSAPFLVALDKGYFAEEGLSVVIDRGTGSAGTVTKIASGAYEMGYADINSMIEFNAKNPDKALQAIAILYNNAPMTVFTLKGKGINTRRTWQARNSARQPAMLADGSFRSSPNRSALTQTASSGSPWSQPCAKPPWPKARWTPLQPSTVVASSAYCATKSRLTILLPSCTRSKACRSIATPS